MFVKILLLYIETHNNILNISKLNIYRIIIYWVHLLSQTLPPKFLIMKMILK